MEKHREVSMEINNMHRQFEINREVVLALFEGINMDKSPGHDGIYPRLLRGER